MRFQFPASALTLRTLATKYSGCARHLFLAPMKRRSGVSTPETVPKMRLASQQSPANPSVTLFKRRRRTRGRKQGQVERGPVLHRSPKLSSRPWRSRILFLSAGARHTILSRKCARGFPLLWTRWAVTRPSGRRWIHGHAIYRSFSSSWVLICGDECRISA